jgi:ankyrin repeat protein
MSTHEKPNNPPKENELTDILSSSLINACMAHDVITAKKLLERGANPNATLHNEPTGVTPLHLAVTHPSPELTKVLLDAGADPKTPYKGFLPIHTAAAKSTPETLQVLLDIDADSITATTSPDNASALHLASYENKAGNAEFLIQKGANPNHLTLSDMTPLHYLALGGAKHFEESQTLKVLITAGANINAQDCEGETPLHTAIQTGKAFLTEQLLDAGANRSIKNKDGKTPEDFMETPDIKLESDQLEGEIAGEAPVPIPIPNTEKPITKNQKTVVEIYLQDHDHPDNLRQHLFTPTWSLVRKHVGSWETELKAEEAADEAFHILNAPEELLKPEQVTRLKEFSGGTRRHPSLSVGDVVKVNGTNYLCAPMGWEKEKNKTKDIGKDQNPKPTTTKKERDTKNWNEITL